MPRLENKANRVWKARFGYIPKNQTIVLINNIQTDLRVENMMPMPFGAASMLDRLRKSGKRIDGKKMVKSVLTDWKKKIAALPARRRCRVLGRYDSSIHTKKKGDREWREIL